MKTPIFSVEEGKVVKVFSSAEAAESYVEPIDIKSAEITFYDADGRMLLPELVEAPRKKKLWGRLSWISGGGWNLREPQGPEADSEALRALLIDFLAEIGPKKTGVALDDLRRMGTVAVGRPVIPVQD